MLHLPSGIAFGVDVGNLLELQRALQGDRIVNSAPQVEEVTVTEKLLREFFNILVMLQNGLDLVWDSR